MRAHQPAGFEEGNVVAMVAENAPSIEDFGHKNAKGPYRLWLESLPVMVPTRIPDQFANRSKGTLQAGVAKLGKGVGSFLVWTDGSYWVLRRK